MDYALTEGVEYFLKWTVFDVANPIQFKVEYDNSLSSVSDVTEAASSVETSQGAIVLSGEGVMATISDMSGNLVFSTKVDGKMQVEVDPGMYVVVLGDFRTKVIVK